VLLTAGARLGPYAILSPLGAGGMGEVYLDDALRLVAIPVQTGATFAGGSPTILFELPSTPTATARTYDVAPDGRFLVIKFPQNDKSATAPTLNVVLNWTAELERLTPIQR
jgi:hypothetical protein